MKNLLVTTIVAASMASSAFADGMVHHTSSTAASSGMFARIETGVMLNKPMVTIAPSTTPTLADKYSNEPLAGFGIGYRFNRMFDVDAKINYYKFSELDFSVNGYASWVNSSKFTPYVTAGLGYVMSEADQNTQAVTFNSVSREKAFATFGAGVRTTLARAVEADLGYRFSSSIESGKFNTDGNNYHEILVGVLYHF